MTGLFYSFSLVQAAFIRLSTFSTLNMHFSTHHPTLLLTSLTLTSLVSAIPSRDVVKCLQHNKVPFIINNSPNWTDYTTPHNLRLQYEPAVITIPETSQQVSASVKCAVAAKLKVQPKGGGHSYASYSSGGQDGSLIVDMERFDTVDVDQCKFSKSTERSVVT